MTIHPHSVEEKAVYAALKKIFKDGAANTRKLSRVRTLIEQNSKQKDIAALVQLHGIESLCKNAQTLLTDSIFLSGDKAKARFAMLAATPALSAPAKGATGGIRALSSFTHLQEPPEASNTEQSHPSGSNTQPSPTPATKAQARTVQPAAQPQTNDQSIGRHDIASTPVEKEATSSKPKLSTSMSNLPYEAQYELLVYAQSCLEHACFDFAEQSMAEILKDNAWDCPEAIELNLFMQDLERRHKRTIPEPVPTKNFAAKHISSIVEIRHAAVHRHRLSSWDMVNVLENAQRLLESLGDTVRLGRITELRHSTYKDLARLDRAEREADEAIKLVRKRFDAKRESLRLLEDDAVSRVDLKREKDRGAAAGRIVHAVLATKAQEAATKRSKRVNDMLFLVAAALYSAVWVCLRLLGTSIVVARTVVNSVRKDWGCSENEPVKEAVGQEAP